MIYKLPFNDLFEEMSDKVLRWWDDLAEELEIDIETVE